MGLVLASTSPRRAVLLRSNGYQFRVVRPIHVEPERDPRSATPRQYAQALAYYKARSAVSSGAEGLVLAADTIVHHEGKLFGKPEDVNDARAILSRLAGTTHEVITGMALFETATDKRLIRHAVTRVKMRPMPDDVLERYLASRAWQGKAGAYGIQDKGDAFVECLEGSFSNVVGLPLELLAEMLEELGAEQICRERPNSAQPADT